MQENRGSYEASNEKANIRLMRRLQKIRKRHNFFLRRYKRYTKRINDTSPNKKLHPEKEEYTTEKSSSVATEEGYVTQSSEEIERENVAEIIESHKTGKGKVHKTAPNNFQDLDVQQFERKCVTDSAVPQSSEETGSENVAEIIERHKTEKGKVHKTAPNNFQELDVQQFKRKCVTVSSSLTANDTTESSSTHLVELRESSFPHKSDVTVFTTKKNEDGKKCSKKISYCLYCSKPFDKMARHLVLNHKDKPEVVKLIACPVGSKQRKIQLRLLRNQGNRAHNHQVLKKGKGEVLPCQYPSVPVKASDYLHCIKCGAYLKRRSLWKHAQLCPLNKGEKALKIPVSSIQAICRHAEPVPESLNALLWKMVEAMREDEITHFVRKEKHLLKFGEYLLKRRGHDSKCKHIIKKLRETARLLIQGQLNGKLNTMSDFFVPANFPHVIDTVKDLAGLNVERNENKTPCWVSKLGTNLKIIADIIECEAMIAGDENAVHNVRMFKRNYETKWSEYLSYKALRNKWNPPQLLQFAEDVKKMHKYLNIQRKTCQTNLKEEPTKIHWAELTKITLCDVILFNRRREGEVSKMSVNDFILRHASQTQPDVELVLSHFEKKLCKHFKHIEIKGKYGQKLTVFLTPDMLAAVELLIKSRRNCDVLDENSFLFARPQALTHFRGSDVICQFAQTCRASNPETLSSTNFRQHMATMSMALYLKDNKIDDLAEFLGQDVGEHPQDYRLSEETLQLAKISKILIALDQEKLCEERNLYDINIDLQGNGSDASDTGYEDDKSVSAALFPSPSSTQSTGSSNEDVPVVGEFSDESNSEKGSSHIKIQRWTYNEIQAVEKTFMDFIKCGKVPGKAECLKCLESFPVVLEGRSWVAVKSYVRHKNNALKNMKKRSKLS